MGGRKGALGITNPLNSSIEARADDNDFIRALVDPFGSTLNVGLFPQRQTQTVYPSIGTRYPGLFRSSLTVASFARLA